MSKGTLKMMIRSQAHDMSTYEKGPVASRRLTTVELAFSKLIGFNVTMPFA